MLPLISPTNTMSNATNSDATYSALMASGGEGGVNINIDVIADAAAIFDIVIKPAFDTSHPFWPWTMLNLLVFSIFVALIVLAVVLSNRHEPGSDMESDGASAQSDVVEEEDATAETSKEV